jgi:hypothetical protein
MSFRQVFGQIWRGLWPARRNADPLSLFESDQLSRFLFQKGEFSVDKRIVKRAAFMPARESRTTSVFQTTGLRDVEILTIARTHVEPERKKEVLGWANLQAQAVHKTGLQTRYDNNPPRHVELVGWPIEKDRQHSIAQLLAAAASLNLVT